MFGDNFRQIIIEASSIISSIFFSKLLKIFLIVLLKFILIFLDFYEVL